MLPLEIFYIDSDFKVLKLNSYYFSLTMLLGNMTEKKEFDFEPERKFYKLDPVLSNCSK